MPRCATVGVVALILALTGLSYAHAAPAPAADSLSALEWRNIGPFRGGRATAIAGIASQPFTFFMGTAGGGVWETMDAGVTWANVSDGFLKSASVGAIAIAPSDPKVIYVGMGEATARANTLHRGDGVYRSTDGGKTWAHIGLDDVDEISRILIDPHDANIVYVAAQGPLYAPSRARGVFRSADGGATWKRVLFTGDTIGPADLAMDPRDSKVLYAAMWDHLRTPWEIRAYGPGSGLYRSIDGGETWSKTDAGLPASLGKLSVAATSDPNRVYALIATDAPQKSGLYRSDDAGKTWTLINNDRNLTRRSWYFTKVFADPTDPQTVWVADLAMHRSTDGGKTFAPVTAPHGDHHELWINPANPKFVAEADDGGGTVSLDGGQTWSAQNNQSTAQIYRVVADNGYPYHLYGGQQDDDAMHIASASFEHGIGRQDWRPTAGNENSFVDVDPDHPDVVWASGYLGEMDELTESTGVSRITNPYPVLLWGNSASRMQTYRYVLNTPILKSRHKHKTLYLAAQMLLATDDDGRTWREAGPDVTNRGNAPNAPQHLGTGETGDGVYGAIDYVAESPLKEGVLWTGSDDGMVAVTPDGGKTWHRSALPGVPDARINAVDPSPHDSATAYVAATRFQFDDQKPYLFKTTDWGKTWTRIGADLPAWTRVVREDPARKGLLYAGTEVGVFVSFDDGASWRPLQSKLPLVPISDLLVHDGDLIAATDGRGFWILDDLSPLRQFGGDAGAVRLYQPRKAYRSSLGAGESSIDKAYGKNAPAGAVIDFQLADRGDAAIDVLDASGAVVRHLDAHGSPGLNRVLWNVRETAPALIADGLVFGGGVPEGRWAPPGSYAVRLTANGVTQSQPLVIEPQPGAQGSEQAYLDQDRFLRLVEVDLATFHDPVLLARDAQRQLAIAEEKITDPTLLADAKALSTRLTVDLETYGDMAFLQVKNNQVAPVDQPTSRALYEKLHPVLAAQIAGLNQALGADLQALNARLSAAGVAPIQPRLPAGKKVD